MPVANAHHSLLPALQNVEQGKLTQPSALTPQSFLITKCSKMAFATPQWWQLVAKMPAIHHSSLMSHSFRQGKQAHADVQSASFYPASFDFYSVFGLIKHHILKPSIMSAAAVDLDNRGLAYGDGFFSTMGVHQGKILWQHHHEARLRSHATALDLEIAPDVVMQQLAVLAAELNEGMMKVVVTRAPQPVRGYGFVTGDAVVWAKTVPMVLYMSEPSTKTLLIDSCERQEAAMQKMAREVGIPIQPAGVAVCLTAQLACLPAPLVGLKSLNRLDNVLVAAEFEKIKQAREQGAEAGLTVLPIFPDLKIIEGLVKNVAGKWVEGVMSNVFYQLADEAGGAAELTWYTPPIVSSGVAGVMRQVIIEQAQAAGNPVIERVLSDEDLSRLTGMFFTNAVRGIQPIQALWMGGRLYNYSLTYLVNG